MQLLFLFHVNTTPNCALQQNKSVGLQLTKVLKEFPISVLAFYKTVVSNDNMNVSTFVPYFLSITR